MTWEPKHFRLFISHVSASHGLAADISEVFRERYGVHAFVAHEDIEPASDWQNEIESALRTTHALLALLTEGFSNSMWCNQEVGWALGRGIPTLSVRCGEDPRGFTGRFQAVRAGERKGREIASRVFASLAKQDATRRRIALAAAWQLRRASSWNEIRLNCVPALDALDPTMLTDDRVLDVLLAAFHEQPDVNSSHHLSRVRQLLVDSGRNPPKATG